MTTQFDELGYALGPRVLTDEDADAIAAEAEAMVADPSNPAYATIHRGVEQPFLHVPNARFEHESFTALHRNPVLIGAIADVIGVDDLQLFECHLFYKPAGEDRVRSWHQDTTYLPFARPYRAVGVWLSLNGATAESGAMVMVPGSHRMGPLPTSLDRDLSAEALIAAGTDGTFVECPVPKGHVHLHHPDIWHASSGNSTSDGRAALSLFFVERGTLFDASGPFARFFHGEHGVPLDVERYPVCR